MRIFGLVIMRGKRYDEHNAAVDREITALKIKIGALEFDKKEFEKLAKYWRKEVGTRDGYIYKLQKELHMAEIQIEQLNEMNAGLWEMKDATMKAERNNDENRID